MTKMAATRDGYGEALLELASNPKVVVLEADLGKSTKSLHFRKAHPERTVSCGIGEQNMLLVGAGLAASGFIPFASTFAIFTERAFEQMRNGVADRTSPSMCAAATVAPTPVRTVPRHNPSKTWPFTEPCRT